MVPVLALDPELGRRLGREEFVAARAALYALSMPLPRGPWRPPLVDPAGLGILLARGVVARDVTLAGRSCTELLGPGDLLRPWVWDEEPATLVSGITWEVVVPGEIVVLGVPTATRMQAWPGLQAELLDRTVRRSMSLAVHLAIGRLAGIDQRLLALLWHLADRWGSVRADHVLLELPLTHELLGRVAGAGRSSVTAALRRLVSRGELRRAPGRSWMLCGGAPTPFDLI